MADSTWLKDPNRRYWVALLGTDYEIAVLRGPAGWRVIKHPYDGSYGADLDCDDDPVSAQSAALDIVEALAQSRIAGAKAVLAGIEVLRG